MSIEVDGFWVDYRPVKDLRPMDIIVRSMIGQWVWLTVIDVKVLYRTGENIVTVICADSYNMHSGFTMFVGGTVLQLIDDDCEIPL